MSSASRRAVRHYERGIRLHRKRRIGEALRQYRRALDLVPAEEPDEALRASILKLAPVLHCAADEPLPLADVAAIYSPARKAVAFHLFYEDDIDFPNDCEPCDHEVMWVAFDPATRPVRRVWSYFHGWVLSSDRSFGDDGRPHAVVQWGKHGTLPLDWREDERLVSAMRGTWDRLHTDGARERETPLARFWPNRYPGSFENFAEPAARVDTRPFVERPGFVMIGEMATAILDFHIIPYNFAVKYAWPDGAY